MGKGSFKMFKAERLSLILLAIALCVWAIISLVTNHSEMPTEMPVSHYIEAIDTLVPDSVEIARADSIKQAKKAKKKKKETSAKPKKPKKPKKQKPAPRKRDHLNDPVPQY